MPTVNRIEQGQPGNLTLSLASPTGVPTDPTPDAATVRVVRANGTELIPTTSANDSGTGVFSIPYTAVHTALLDTWTAYWTTTVSGQVRVDKTVHEVVGGFLFNLSELRAMSPQLANTTNYPDTELVRMRITVEQALENELRYALVPRYEIRTVRGRYDWPLRLKPHLRAVRSVTVNGTAWSVTDLAGAAFDDSGFLYGSSWGWYPGTSTGPLTVEYEHGLDEPPEPLRMAGRTLAKVWLTAGPIDDRTNTFTSTEGGTFSLVTPGRGGSVFGVPSVDAIVQSNRIPAIA